MEKSMLRKWQIRRMSSIGQQLVTAYDVKNEEWVKESAYGEPNFEATEEEAKQILAELKADARMPVPIKWIRLYRL